MNASLIGLDIAKAIFQVSGINATGRFVLPSGTACRPPVATATTPGATAA